MSVDEQFDPVLTDPAPDDKQEPIVYPVFQRELMRQLVETLHKQNSTLTDLRDVIRDLRDELEYARIERTTKPKELT